MDLEAIANAERIIIERGELKGCDAKIIFGNNYGLITINNSIYDERQIRFIIAHEMGHYYNEKLEIKKYKTGLRRAQSDCAAKVQKGTHPGLLLPTSLSRMRGEKRERGTSTGSVQVNASTSLSTMKKDGREKWNIGMLGNHRLEEMNWNNGQSLNGEEILRHELKTFYIGNYTDDYYENVFNSERAKEFRANKFAAELLMPTKKFKEKLNENTGYRNKEFKFEYLEDAAECFNVSLTATAIRHADIGAVSTAVIFSKNGKVKWTKIHKKFPYKGCKVGSSVPFYSNTNEKRILKKKLVPVYEWFEDYDGEVKNYLLSETNVNMSNYNSVLTILSTTEW